MRLGRRPTSSSVSTCTEVATMTRPSPTGAKPIGCTLTTGPTSARPGTSRIPSAKAPPTSTRAAGSTTSKRSGPRTTTRPSISSLEPMPRAAREPELIDFKPDDRAAVLARMDGLTGAGGGWINLSPALEEDAEVPPRSSTFGIFGGRGPDVPLCTWVPGTSKTPVQLGLQHGAGTRAAPLLKDMGLAVPQGWRVTGDHARRGLVIMLPS